VNTDVVANMNATADVRDVIFFIMIYIFICSFFLCVGK